MNILFLSVGEFSNIEAGSVHIDLVRQLADYGHNVFVACKNERRHNKPTSLTYESGLNVLRIKTGNIKNTNVIEKGISTILIEYQYLSMIKKYWGNIKFDVVLYHTPPISFTKVIKYIKQRDNAVSYLLLKDIFPQNAVDMGMFKKKSILYKYFRLKEKALYAISDKIGCMSQANIRFLLNDNPEIPLNKVEISPNSIAIRDVFSNTDNRLKVLQNYGLPIDKTIFVYGGNLGRPQCVPFIVECLKQCEDVLDAFFLIIGSGTDFHILADYYNTDRPSNVKVMSGLPKREYEALVNACDVGLVFLDYNFTIPNYPSRILSYMQSSMPILCVTDPVTDVGRNLEDANCGWSCMSNNPKNFRTKILEIIKEDISLKGHNSLKYLKENYEVSVVAKNLTNSINNIVK